MAGQSQFAFGDPDTPTAFDTLYDDTDKATQSAQQVQSQFDQNRSLRNYIQRISEGASSKRGAIRYGIDTIS